MKYEWAQRRKKHLCNGERCDKFINVNKMTKLQIWSNGQVEE